MRAQVIAVVSVLALSAAACGTGSTEVSERAGAALSTTSSTTSGSTTTTTTPKCDDVSPPALAPLPDREEASADEFMKELYGRDDQKLIVAVDENTRHLSSRDALSAELEGTEIDIAKRIAQRIFGGGLGEHVQFVTVTTKEKIDLVERGDVDLSISAISINCERWKEVAFSTEYLRATQAFLVRDPSIRSKEQLSGKRVCVTTGSTSVAIVEGMNIAFRDSGKEPAELVEVDTRNDCHLELQEGTVDAYLGHDTFIRGMQEQDPGLESFLEGTESHYGIAIGKDHPYFVRYVNGVLDELRSDPAFPELAGAAS